MKAHLTRVSVALLSAVLILGCQDVATGPDGLVPQFDKKGFPNPNCEMPDTKGHCHGDEDPGTVPTPAAPFVEISHITGDIATVTDPITVDSGRKDTQISFGGPGIYAEQIVLSENFVKSQPGWGTGDRSVCFEDKNGNRTWGGLSAGAREGKGARVDDVGEAIVSYYFVALGIDGETPLGYALEVTGTFTTSVPGAAFVPGVNEYTTVTWDGGLMWVNNGGDGQGCVGGGGKQSVLKTVTVGGTVTIKGVAVAP